MDIQNQIFFHVGSHADWQVGQTITIGADYNDRFKAVLNRPFLQTPDGQNQIPQYVLFEGVNEYIQTGRKPEYLPPSYHADPVKTLTEMTEFVRANLNITRELFFEDMRKERFYEKPSRLRAIHVIPPTREALGFWLPQLKAPGQMIYKVVLNGKYHENSGEYLNPTVFTFEQMRANAYGYWTEHQVTDTSKHEWLFEGDLKVMEIVGSQSVNNQPNYQNSFAF